MATFDLVITGGEVVDPGAGLSGRLDVGVTDGRIAAVAPNLPTGGAGRVVDATGQIVTPGLVDLHTHIYWGATYWGIEADPVAAQTGVTTWLDVGSSGAFNFHGFRRYVAEANRARCYALLNLSSIGLTANTFELANLDYCNVDLAAMIVERNRDVILGIKARIDPSTTRGAGIEPLRRARELADRVGLPLMVHIGAAPPHLGEVLPLMKPGDILTHCFTGHQNRVINDARVVLPMVKQLWDAGMVMDIGHGTGSFSFDTAEAMLAQGLPPDVISTDIHQMARQGPMYDMPTTLSKFLTLGMSLPDVIERGTSRPARAMGRPDLGTLRPGAAADIALFRLERGAFSYYDITMSERRGEQRLVNTATYLAGEELPRLPERPAEPFATIPERQQPAIGLTPGQPVTHQPVTAS
ncbi:MAG: amidohydrolase/deacetylase family metallohydrolase [Chloroflexi bacterium]|nr:amidohydrolase/deacetylase family metallohydrolase [Chloroflexota bacterium]